MTHRDFDSDAEEHAEEVAAGEEAMISTLLAFANGEITQRAAEVSLDELGRALQTRSAVWIAATLPALYIDAMNGPERDLDGDLTNSVAGLGVQHLTALRLAERAFMEDLVAATGNMTRDAKQAVREVASLNLYSSMIRGPRVAARAVASDMEERGVRVIDSVGRRWRSRGYALMVMRTKTVETYNRAALARGGEMGSRGVFVSDGGPGDVDQPCIDANEQYWSNDYAATHVLEHPNCRRAFTALPRDWDGEFDRE